MHLHLSTLVVGLQALAVTTASPLNKRTARTSPPSGCLVVSTSPSSGQYSDLNDAIAAIGSGSSSKTACIFVYAGTYTVGSDQIYINYAGNLTLYGETANTGSYVDNVVTFQRNETSTAAGNLDASSVMNVVSANFKAYNMNFKNTYGAGTQAVAVTANGNQQGYYGVGFYGYQDTLYAKSGAQYYSNCYIEGAVDYIFGGAAAWFGECTIASNGGGAITANSRTTADSTWYVIDHSTITEASGYSLTGKVYLGRPWRALARVIFQNSVLTNVVAAAGWTTLAADATPIFEEYDNSGAGSSTSARVCEYSWETNTLFEDETVATAAVTKSQLWGSNSWESWTDTSY